MATTKIWFDNSRRCSSLEQEGGPLRWRINNMSGFYVEVLPVMVDLSYFVWINVSVVFDISDKCVATPWAFPKLVENSEIFVSLSVSLIMLYWTLNSDRFEGTLFPWCDDIPNMKLVCLIQNSLNMQYHPIRPPVRWSRVEKRLASKNGGSNEVLAVIPNAKFFVTIDRH
jgi:hypothetical protein